MLTIGSQYLSNNYGPVIVIGAGKNSGFYLVQFIQTGTQKEFRESWIKEGCIRDPYAPKLCGIACTGNIKTKGKYKCFYSIWHDMINRCYNPKDKRHEAYKNVSVSSRWLVFENFYNDIIKIEGFNEEKIRNGELILDKDLKQRYAQNKVYSIDTCTWIPKYENNRVQDSQQHYFVAISPEGAVFRDNNISEFARSHNLNRRSISGVLHNRASSTHGWKFTFEDIV